MIKCLVTGGAGYKGTLLTQALLDEGCDVTILDNFMYGFEPALRFAASTNCHIVKKDIRNLTKPDVAGFDYVFHLAAVSGYPACEANPHSAQTINVASTQILADLLDPEQVLVYASTTSMYGKAGTVRDETSPPDLVSLYGVTKWQGEQISMQRANSIALRFATLFGVSHKMRPDLMLNDFVHKAVVERSVILFDDAAVRTFLHVRDAIRAYVMILQKREQMLGQVFNVGSDTMNFSKLQLAEKIRQQIPFEIVRTGLADPDRRDFIINFDKLHALGFRAAVSIDEGIAELIRLYQWYRPYTPYQTI